MQEQLRRLGAFGIQESLRQSPAFWSHNEFKQMVLGSQERFRRSGVVGIEEILRDSPAYQFQEQLWQGWLGIREQLRQFGAFGIDEALQDSPVLHMREQIERGLLGLQEQLHQSLVHSAHGIFFKSSALWLQEQLEGGLLRFQEQFEKYGLLGIQSALKTVSAEKLLVAIARIENPLDWLREPAWFLSQEELGDGMLQIGPDGTASLAGETATAAEIKLAFQELFDHLQDYLADIRERLRRLRKPVRALIAWFVSRFFIPFLIGLYFQQQASFELREMQRRLELKDVKNRREVIAALKKSQASRSVAEEGNYSVVIGDRVRVRAGPSRQALVKGFLLRGTVVRFLEKHGRWTAVKYTDPDTLFVESGWVFNKYLRRVRWRAG